MFTPTGTFLFQVGSFGSADGQFYYPHGVALGADDSIYVVDQFNQRVQRFLPAPAPSLSVTKPADQTSVVVGQDIDYHVTVTNTGNQALTGISVSDPNASSCAVEVADLPVGAPPVVVNCGYTPGDGDVGTYTNVATVDSDQTDPVASNPVDVTVGRLRPDAKIRRGTGSTAGNDVYNTSGADQTKNGSVGAGGTVTFTVTFQNDGTVDDDFFVRGPASNTRFRVTYLFGGVDVTARVTAGTFRLEGVPAGFSYALTVKIKAKAGAPRGAVFTAKVKATSAFDATRKDVVKAVVTRV